MTCNVYRSSNYSKIIFGFLTASVLLPGVFIILYGIEKRNHNWPLMVIGLLFCSYTIYIFQRCIYYKVIVRDDCIEIHNMHKRILVKFEDIIDIKLEKGICYIIDKVNINGDYFIRGTSPKIKYEINNDRVEINAKKLPTLEKAFLQNYSELIKIIIDRYSMATNQKIDLPEYINSSDRSSLISIALFKKVGEKQSGIKEILTAFTPYFLLMGILLINLVVYYIFKKGACCPYIISMIKLVFPIYAILTIYFFTIKHIPYVKKIIDINSYPIDIPRKHILTYLSTNIITASIILGLFFYMINRISL